MNNLAEIIFLSMFVGIVLIFILNIVRRDGFKGAMFNAKVARTVGEVQGLGPSLVRTKIKIHLLERNAEKFVGLEFVATSIMSYEMMPVTLEVNEARNLIAALEQTIEKI